MSSFFVYAWDVFFENNKQKIFLFSKVFPLEKTNVSFPAYTLDNYSYEFSVEIKYDGGIYGTSQYGWNIRAGGVEKSSS